MFLHKLYKFKNADNLEAIQEEAVKMIKMLGNWLLLKGKESDRLSDCNMCFQIKFKYIQVYKVCDYFSFDIP